MLQEQMVVYVVSLKEGMQLAAKLELLGVPVVDFSEKIRGVEACNSFYSALPALDEGSTFSRFTSSTTYSKKENSLNCVRRSEAGLH